MPSEFNHIDEYFRRKEMDADAPNHLQDQHWLKMKDLMSVPGGTLTPGKSSFFKFWTITGLSLAVIATAIIIYFSTASKKTSPGNQQAIQEQLQSNRILSTVKDSLPVLAFVPKQDSIQLKSGLIVLKSTRALTGTLRDTMLVSNLKMQFPDSFGIIEDKIQIKQNNLKLISDTIKLTSPKTIELKQKVSEAEQKIAFEKFFKALEKPEQLFVINPSRDTTIYGTEGTVLFIPANSFLSGSGEIKGKVTVTLREFYGLDDIVGNKLSTMSNGEALVSGGMLQIDARAEGEPLTLKKDALLDLKMPAAKFDPQMQLFTATTNATLQDNEKEQILTNNSAGTMNWIPQGQHQRFYSNNQKLIRVWNMTNNPVDVRYRHEFNPSKLKSVGVFNIPWNSAYSEEEIKTELIKRYGKYYDEIKVHKRWKPLFVKQRVLDSSFVKVWYDSPFVGDTVTMHISRAVKLKYITRDDSLRYEAVWKEELEQIARRNQSFQALAEIKDQYNFKISALGWVNCDRFLAYPKSQLTDFTIALQNEFHDQYFHSVLLFQNKNVLMQGYMDKGTIRFRQIPVGEDVVLICIGVKEGKAYSTIQKLKVNRNIQQDIRFESVTPQEFRDKLKQFGTVLNRG